MMGMKRSPEPAFLQAKGSHWSLRWRQRCEAAGSSARTPQFQWPRFQGRSVGELLLDALMPLTAHHCAYCDYAPLGVGSRRTVDHFRPKSRFRDLVYAWSNLFPCCDRCQSKKGEQWDEFLLKPDEVEYSFERYFICDVRDGLLPNPAANELDRARARRTIELCGLDDPALVLAMRRSREHRKLLPLEECSFRFPP